MVFMAKELLYRRKGMHVTVYVHFWRRLWHARNKCQSVLSTSACATVVFLTKFYISANKLSAGCAYAPRIRAVFPLALGDEGGGIQLIYAGYLLLAWGVLLTCVKTKVLSELSLFLDTYRSH